MKKQIINLLHKSLAEVESLVENNKIPIQVYEAYIRVWNWSCPRFGGNIGIEQENFWNQYGMDKYYLKMNKTRKAFGFNPIV
jgi:hypothetical protein